MSDFLLQGKLLKGEVRKANQVSPSHDEEIEEVSPFVVHASISKVVQ